MNGKTSKVRSLVTGQTLLLLVLLDLSEQVGWGGPYAWKNKMIRDNGEGQVSKMTLQEVTQGLRYKSVNIAKWRPRNIPTAWKFGLA